MIKRDTERIVRKVAVLDNRRVDEAVIDAWHEIIGHLSYLVAERALLRARQDPNTPYLEPKHVLGKARDAIIELNAESAEAAREAEDNGTGEPEPICREHNSRITHCVDCCKVLSLRHKEYPREDLHAWAVANLYTEESVVA